MPKIAKFVQKH